MIEYVECDQCHEDVRIEETEQVPVNAIGTIVTEYDTWCIDCLRGEK